MMRHGEILYYLELRSLQQLRVGSRKPHTLGLVEEFEHNVDRQLILRIGRPYAWPSQRWANEEWETPFTQDDLRHWVGHAGRRVGVACLRFDGAVIELDTFGLLPEYLGRGLGAGFLTEVVQAAWHEAPGAKRVWLHTSSADAPAALPNYLARGFSLYRTVKPTV